MRLLLGKTYYLRYLSYHHDPVPYLYVVYWDRKYTKGFNLHYLPNIRFKIPIERYKRLPEAKWQKAFENTMRIGIYKKFLDDLERANELKLSKTAWSKYFSYLSNKYPWCMDAFRCYHTPLLKLRTDYPKKK